ncbi:MAG: integration host factor subunit beta [Muribaculaceae bacterium]|nr:integration host factor subunit beta [Muribaculaceae bacterium]
MTKADIVNEIARRTGIERRQVNECMEQFMQIVKDSVTRREGVYLRGFGTFTTKHRNEKAARNITKGTAVVIPAHDIPFFKPSEEFKGML